METPEERKQLDEALARSRAAFAHMTEDEIMEKVIEIIDEIAQLATQAGKPTHRIVIVRLATMCPSALTALGQPAILRPLCYIDSTVCVGRRTADHERPNHQLQHPPQRRT